MRLTNEELVKEFSKVNEHVQDLSLEQIKEIVYTPWRFLKSQMESGELNPVRIKYFGIFQVKKGRAKYYYDKLEEDLKSGKLSEEKYNKFKIMLENYLK